MRNKKEHEEAVAFVQWMNHQNLSFFHPIQENTIKNFGYIRKMKAEGWNKGISDYLIFIPQNKLSKKFKSRECVMLAVELKKPRTRKKNGEFKALSSDGITVYPEQEQFLEMFNKIEGCAGEICFGAQNAIEYVMKYLK